MSSAETGDASVVRALFAHHRWANLKLLEFCQTLSDQALDTAVVGCYGSIRETLGHMVRGDVSYVSRVNGNLPPQHLSEAAFPGFTALEEVASWAADELLNLALATRQASLVREREGHLGCEYPLASLMLQAINHATEHRAQIATIITQLGLEPPDLSGWEYMTATGTFRDFTYDES